MELEEESSSDTPSHYVHGADINCLQAPEESAATHKKKKTRKHGRVVPSSSSHGTQLKKPKLAKQSLLLGNLGKTNGMSDKENVSRALNFDSKTLVSGM
jgi:hypothetical protein